jgi:FAD/FMN-containing dehydrogenase
MDTAVTLHVAARPADLEALRGALRGRLVRPTDPTYEERSRRLEHRFQGRPIAIVRAADAGDVATAVGFARRNGLEIAVRAGGHSLAGHSTGDGVLVIDMRDLRGLHVDLEQGVAWAGVGSHRRRGDRCARRARRRRPVRRHRLGGHRRA